MLPVRWHTRQQRDHELQQNSIKILLIDIKPVQQSNKPLPKANPYQVQRVGAQNNPHPHSELQEEHLPLCIS